MYACTYIFIRIDPLQAVTGFGGFKEMTKQRKWTQLAREVETNISSQYNCLSDPTSVRMILQWPIATQTVIFFFCAVHTTCMYMYTSTYILWYGEMMNFKLSIFRD